MNIFSHNLKLRSTACRVPVLTAIFLANLFISEYCYCELPSKGIGNNWLSASMKYVNPVEMLDQTEKQAYYGAKISMESFFEGKITFEDYREAVERYAKGRYFRASSAAQELKMIDYYGKTHLESLRDKELNRISIESSAREISPEEFRALEVLFEEYEIDSTAWQRRMQSHSPSLLRRVDKAKKTINIMSFSYMEYGANLKYWRLIYDGVPKSEAEMIRLNYISQQNSRELIDATKTMSSEIQDLEREVKKLRKQLNN